MSSDYNLCVWFVCYEVWRKEEHLIKLCANLLHVNDDCMGP
jgi:hypothetical protein